MHKCGILHDHAKLTTALQHFWMNFADFLMHFEKKNFICVRQSAKPCHNPLDKILSKKGERK